VTTHTDAHTLATAYLHAEEHEDLAALRQLFAPNPTIRNAANPPASGPTALEDFACSFWERTSRRHFELIDTAADGHDTYALATAELTFNTGVAFGPHTTTAPIDVHLVIALRFHLDGDGLVDQLDIHHETTTAARLAAQGPRQR
jgi:hypothetical protein